MDTPTKACVVAETGIENEGRSTSQEDASMRKMESINLPHVAVQGPNRRDEWQYVMLRLSLLKLQLNVDYTYGARVSHF